jgi:hypothetical protein
MEYRDYGKYDVSGALEGADGYDVTQAVGAGAEETLRSVGDLLGDNTGVEIANTAIDGIHAGAETAANWFSGLF